MSSLPKQKQIMVVFEGMDKTGKTTLLREFNKRTGFKYVVLDRFTTSSKVYDHFYGRKRFKYYDKIEKVFAKKFAVLVVLCSAKEEDVKNRLKSVGEELPIELANVVSVDDCFFRMWYEGHLKHCLCLNTSERNVEYCMMRITSELLRMERIYGEQADHGSV